MKLKIKLIDNTLEFPEYKTSGAVGFDLVARVDTEIKANEMGLIPLNVVVKTPKGYGFFLYSRSSTPMKKGLIVANSVGIIDQDYSGEDDEVKLCVLNVTKKTVKVERGERIAQAVIMKVEKPILTAVKKMSGKSRGGFGTTG